MRLLFTLAILLATGLLCGLRAQITVTYKPNAAVGKDARVFNQVCTPASNSTTTNYGNEIELNISSWTYNANGCPTGVMRQFLEFTQLNTIPSNAVIVSAQLNLYGVASSAWGAQGNSSHPTSPYGTTNPCWVSRVIAPWNENTVTWNNQPAVTTVNQATIPVSTSQFNYNATMNVTGMVQDMVSFSQNYGFRLMLQNEAFYRSVLFASSDNPDAARWPELVVEYIIPAPPTSTGCVNILNLPDSIYSCKNNSVQLNPTVTASGTLITTDTTWTPATGLSNPNIINPIATIGTTSQLYKLTILALTPNNFVLNGNFNNGATGFSTSYVPGTGGAFGLLSLEGQYAVTTSPNLVHNNFAAFPDHTGNVNGQMMVVNGAGTANTNVWCQTITVQPNSFYNFSAWGASCVTSSPAILQFSINGTALGTPLNLPTVNGQWVNFTSNWFSGTNTSVNICIVDQQTATSGNDFAIDDIEFRQQCQSVDSVYINVTNLQTAIDKTITLRCEKDSVKFFAVNNGQTPEGYEWEFGDSSPSDTAKNPSHVYNTQGIFPIRLITRLKGCRDTAYSSVNTVHPVAASFTMDRDSVCIKDDIQFISTGTSSVAPASHSYSFGDGKTASTPNAVHSYDSAGVYIVRYVIGDAIPCRDTATDTVYVFQSYEPQITLSDTLLCEGETITLSMDSSHPRRSHIWILGDGSSYPDLTRLTHAYDTSGSFEIMLAEDFNICADDTARKTVNVFAYPRVDLGPDTFLCVMGAPIALQPATLTPGARWRWNTGDTTVRILARNYGKYWVEAVTAEGCNGADSVDVFKNCYIDIPNAFTPDGDGLNDYFLPRALLGRQLTKFSMQVFNRWGQIIFETKSVDGRGWDGRYNDIAQPTGVYIYLIDVEISGNIKENYKGNVTLLR